jgi:hypothetical protein
MCQVGLKQKFQDKILNIDRSIVEFVVIIENCVESESPGLLWPI